MGIFREIAVKGRNNLTSYTVGPKSKAVVMFDPVGRESATIIGNGVKCCWYAGISGILDHSCPAPWPESFVKKLALDVWLRK